MTGFGQAATSLKRNRLRCEIRSVNHKGLDLSIRLPAGCRQFETELHREISKRLKRGKVEVTVTLVSTGGGMLTRINKGAVLSYCADLLPIAKKMKQDTDELLQSVILLPGAVLQGDTEPPPMLLKKIREIVFSAIKQIERARSDEGKVIEKQFRSGIVKISELLVSITGQDPVRMEKIRQRLDKNLKASGITVSDKNRFEEEFFYYIEKLDIAEEITRMRSHCAFFIETLNGQESQGKKLEFIAQEILREANTIGSKAQDEIIQRSVVEIKDEVEKIREQVQNVA
ncbi:MAG: YicC family protein [Bacteroidetes bacterium]|nr:YicC family protein [Bacteroidota bacterium]